MFHKDHTVPRKTAPDDSCVRLASASSLAGSITRYALLQEHRSAGRTSKHRSAGRTSKCRVDLRSASGTELHKPRDQDTCPANGDRSRPFPMYGSDRHRRAAQCADPCRQKWSTVSTYPFITAINFQLTTDNRRPHNRQPKRQPTQLANRQPTLGHTNYDYHPKGRTPPTRPQQIHQSNDLNIAKWPRSPGDR